MALIIKFKNQLFNIKEEIKKDERGEFGMSTVISIAVGLIITSFIVIPNIRTFATSIMTDMQSWWNNSISAEIFPD